MYSIYQEINKYLPEFWDVVDDWAFDAAFEADWPPPNPPPINWGDLAKRTCSGTSITVELKCIKKNKSYTDFVYRQLFEKKNHTLF